VLELDIPVALPSLEDQDVVVSIPGLFAAPRLVVDGRLAPRGASEDTYLLRAPDGTTRTVVLARRLIDPVPRVECDGVSVAVARPFGWSEYLWFAVPLVMLSLGGGLPGALLGAAAGYINARILRQPRSGGGRYARASLVVLAAAATLGLLRVAVMGLVGMTLMMLLFGRWSCSELTFMSGETAGSWTIPVEVTAADEHAHRALGWVAAEVANGKATGGRPGRWLVDDFEAFTRERNVDPFGVRIPVFIIRGTPVRITPINHCL